MKLLEIVNRDAIITGLSATKRDDAIAEIVDRLVEAGEVSPELRDEFIAEIIKRENRGSTGFGHGVAVPHVKHPAITTMVVAVATSELGVEFYALDKQPVYTVFLLLSPQSRPEEHLQAMELIFKNLSKDTFRRELRQAEDAQKIHQLLDDADHHRVVG